VTVASDDDGPSRPSHGSIHGGAEDGVHVTDQPQAARWGTLAVELHKVEVRGRIERGLATLGPREAVIGGSASVRGFVIKFRSRKRVHVADVELQGWEGGTQIHAAVPADHKSKDLAILVDWLSCVMGISR
jgi:hypothetical protein